MPIFHSELGYPGAIATVVRTIARARIKMRVTGRILSFAMFISVFCAPMEAATAPARKQFPGPVYVREHSQPAVSMRSSGPLRRTAAQPRMKSLPLPTNAGFLTATQTVLPGSATAFAVGDFNGDGLKDVATVLFDNTGQAQLGVLLGAGNGSFQSPVLM